MDVHLFPTEFQLLFEEVGSGLPLVLRNDDATDEDAQRADVVDGTHHVVTVVDAHIGADLVLLQVSGVDRHDKLRLILEFLQQLDFCVDVKTRQNARSVIVVEQLAAKLKIQLAAEAVDTFKNGLGLLFYVQCVVKTDLHKCYLQKAEICF